MASDQPIVRQISWLSIIPQLLVMTVIFGIMHLVGSRSPILHGAVIYLAISISLRRLVPSAHRRGMSLFKREEFTAAIPEFEKSYAFFTKHKWIDNWRYLVLLSSSRISYREMALLNIAYCYGQSGNGAKSKEYYRRILEEFPDSGIAKSSLRLFESVEKLVQPTDSGNKQ
jgi:tetratricopeptide (TPR) repeat protein